MAFVISVRVKHPVQLMKFPAAPGVLRIQIESVAKGLLQQPLATHAQNTCHDPCAAKISVFHDDSIQAAAPRPPASGRGGALCLLKCRLVDFHRVIVPDGNKCTVLIGLHIGKVEPLRVLADVLILGTQDTRRISASGRSRTRWLFLLRSGRRHRP